MFNRWATKLENWAALTDTDRASLTKLKVDIRHVPARHVIVREGEPPGCIHFVQEGFACNFKTRQNGTRQIMALLLPGDFCDLHGVILNGMDCGVATLSACTVVEIPRSTILELTMQHPSIARALWRCTLVDQEMLAEWLVNLGRRDADRRLAHLFCELLLRLRAAGRVQANSYELPLNRSELGETLGTSTVHANRSLRVLRTACLVTWEGNRVSIPDLQRLKNYCNFNSNYLHLTKRRGQGSEGGAV